MLAAVGAALAFGLVAGAVFLDPPAPHPPSRIQADAVLVLSGDVDYLRVEAAARLWRDRSVRQIVVTGAGVGGDSATALRTEAIRLGVPAEAVVTETESTTTRENVVNAARILRAQGWRRVALVTSRTHMARALSAARTAAPDVDWIAFPVADPGPAARIRRTRVQEWLKWTAYRMRGWA